MSMKPKVALVKAGFLPAGSENVRGRLSGEAIAKCKALAAEGWDIEGYTVSQSSTPTAPVVEKTPVANGEKVIHDIVMRFPLDTPAHAFIDGKRVKVSMREACGNCRVSLVCCTCGAPSVVRPDGRGVMRAYIQGDT